MKRVISRRTTAAIIVATMTLRPMNKMINQIFVCLLLIVSVRAAENDSVAHDTKSSEWVVLAGNQTISKIVTKNSVTKEFIDWLVSNNRTRGIISMLLDDNQNITGVTWNICDYADEAMIMQLSSISSLLSSEIVVSKNSLPEEALERIRKANPNVSYSRKLHIGESSSLIIEKVNGTNMEHIKKTDQKGQQAAPSNR